MPTLTTTSDIIASFEKRPSLRALRAALKAAGMKQTYAPHMQQRWDQNHWEEVAFRNPARLSPAELAAIDPTLPVDFGAARRYACQAGIRRFCGRFRIDPERATLADLAAARPVRGDTLFRMWLIMRYVLARAGHGDKL